MRESKRAGGRVCGVDIVMMADICWEGRREVATIPPIECPMTIMEVFAGYRDRMYSSTREVYAICDLRVDP